MQNLWAGIFSGRNGWGDLHKLRECDATKGWNKLGIGEKITGTMER